MHRLRGWILPGMGLAVILAIIAHNTIPGVATPGGLPLPEPSPIDGKPPPPMPGWAYLAIILGLPFYYPPFRRFCAWVSGEPRR